MSDKTMLKAETEAPADKTITREALEQISAGVTASGTAAIALQQRGYVSTVPFDGFNAICPSSDRRCAPKDTDGEGVKAPKDADKVVSGQGVGRDQSPPNPGLALDEKPRVPEAIRHPSENRGPGPEDPRPRHP